MRFEQRLEPDRAAVLNALGYGGRAPDAATEERIQTALTRVTAAAEPRWVWKPYTLEWPPLLVEAAFSLPGEDIRRHLAGCHRAVLLALTLGGGVEQAIRKAEVEDLALAVIMDTAASDLAERYADAAEGAVRGQMEAGGEYVTGRFSPGYGDLPIALQKELLEALGAPKAIGLTVSGSGILLPRKSITAVLGVAHTPVQGQQAGCENCALHGKCSNEKEGMRCDKTNIDAG